MTFEELERIAEHDRYYIEHQKDNRCNWCHKEAKTSYFCVIRPAFKSKSPTTLRTWCPIHYKKYKHCYKMIKRPSVKDMFTLGALL